MSKLFVACGRHLMVFIFFRNRPEKTGSSYDSTQTKGFTSLAILPFVNVVNCKSQPRLRIILPAALTTLLKIYHIFNSKMFRTTGYRNFNDFFLLIVKLIRQQM